MKIIDKIPWVVLIFLCATIGLAPFGQPHLLEKLRMLGNGTLVHLIDIFDLLMHSAPWLLMVLKLLRWFRVGKTS